MLTGWSQCGVSVGCEGQGGEGVGCEGQWGEGVGCERQGFGNWDMEL